MVTLMVVSKDADYDFDQDELLFEVVDEGSNHAGVCTSWCPPSGYVFYALGLNSRLASKDDAARALAPWLAKRDFLR